MAESVAQEVEYQPSKHKALNSSPSTTKNIKIQVNCRDKLRNHSPSQIAQLLASGQVGVHSGIDTSIKRALCQAGS
jgi:hypothetical protein